MKKKQVLLLGTVLILAAAATSVMAWTEADDENFQAANLAYRQRNYQDAASLYSGLVETYPKSAVLHYNLGNSYYRTGAIGKSILAFERALKLEPRNRDVRDNLSFTRSLLEYRIEDKRNWYIRAGDHFLRYFRDQEISFLALLAYFIFVSSCTSVVFFNPGIPWGWKRKTLLCAAAFFFVLWGLKNIQSHVMRDAIVMNTEAEVRYGPSDTDQVAFRLGEGLKVHVVDHRDRWSRIILVNGESGWVRNSHLAEVQPR